MVDVRTIELPALCHLRQFVDYYTERPDPDFLVPEQAGITFYLMYVVELEEWFIDIWATYPPEEQKFELVTEEIEPSKEVDIEEKFSAGEVDDLMMNDDDTPEEIKSKIVRACEIEVGILKFIHKHNWHLIRVLETWEELKYWRVSPGWQKSLLEDMFGPVP